MSKKGKKAKTRVFKAGDLIFYQQKSAYFPAIDITGCGIVRSYDETEPAFIAIKQSDPLPDVYVQSHNVHLIARKQTRKGT